jgi:small subunit ribosomal protein S9
MAGIELRNGLRRAIQCLRRPLPQYSSHTPRRRPIIPHSTIRPPTIARPFHSSCRRLLDQDQNQTQEEPDFKAASPLDGLDDLTFTEEIQKSIYQSHLSNGMTPEEATEAAGDEMARRLDTIKRQYDDCIEDGMTPDEALLLVNREMDALALKTEIEQVGQQMLDAYMESGMSYEEALELVNYEFAKEEGDDEMPSTKKEKKEPKTDEDVEKRNNKFFERLRIVPASPSYFTGKPNFTDDLIALKALLRKYQTLPIFPPGQAPRVAWKSVEQYKAMVGAEPVKSARYHRLLEVLKRLNSINSAIMPEEVAKTLDRYKRNIDLSQTRKKQGYVNEDGIALGVGRRKTSTARAYIVEGEGEVLVNGKSLTQFFARIHDRESAVWALKATERVDKYNIFALVKGGGATGQAEALTLAVAKALLVHEPLLKPALRRGKPIPASESKPPELQLSLILLFLKQSLTYQIAGCVTRDPRMVERKKPGHLKARKKPAWVKR